MSKVYIPRKERKKKPPTVEASPCLSGNTNPDGDTKSEEDFIGRRVRKPVDVSESSEDELIRHLVLYLLDDFRCDFGHMVIVFLVDIRYFISNMIECGFIASDRSPGMN